ncbi:MAG: HAD family hydrolase [Hyphomicrobiales bacterium]
MELNRIKTVAFDADDTLWANEHIFQEARENSYALVKDFVSREDWAKATFDMEIHNLSLYGYGVKSYVLSLIEAALKISGGKIPQYLIGKMLEIGKDMLNHPVKLLPDVKETLETLSGNYKLFMITKGELLEQEGKIKRSGVAELFSNIEIVSEKDEKTYSNLLDKYAIPRNEFMMVGNSLKSDVLPVCKIGGHGIHIPYHVTWEWEVPKNREEEVSYIELERINMIPELLK